MPPLGYKSALHWQSKLHHKPHSQQVLREIAANWCDRERDQTWAAAAKSKGILLSVRVLADREERRTLFCIKVFICFIVLNQRARFWSGGTAAGDKLTAVFVSVCHRIGDVGHSSRGRAATPHPHPTPSGSSDKGWMKKTDGEIGLVHYLSQSNRGRLLYAQPSDAAPTELLIL